MAGFSLELPTLQNWSCHSCSGCCREHGIFITDAEHDRIVKQDWTVADGIAADQPVFVRTGGWFGKRGWRLAHQPDGRCVFLDDQGLCRIHAKFGEPAKPLACRLYPYVFHPKGKQVVLSLRYSCPSVVRNRGRSMQDQSTELRELARQVVPEGITKDRAPRLNEKFAPGWDDILIVVRELETTMADSAAPLSVRLLRALTWIDLLDSAQLQSISGPRLTELTALLRGAAEEEIPADLQLESVQEPSSMGRRLFRLLGGYYARKDTFAPGRGGMLDRVRLFTSALRLARGRGELPSLSPQLVPMDFAALEFPRGPLPAEAEQILQRYFLVKLQGMHFCGRAYYGVPLVEGLRSLVLIYPVTMWLARWLAASRDHASLTVDDVAAALAMADHHHGFSPALGTIGGRGRTRTLHKLGDLPRLVAWYSRSGGDALSGRAG